MDAESSKIVSMNDMDDDAEEGTSERRHRRDFVGTELERPKKHSRQRTKKRKRSGLDLMDDSDSRKPNSLAETDPMQPPTKKKTGLLGVRGASRVFNVLEDNDMTPQEVIEKINDPSNDSATLAKLLAKYLWEPKTSVLEKCFNVFTRAQMIQWLEETIATEKGLGMQTLTGERRKSPGGVFFTLIGRDAPEQERIATIGLPMSQRNLPPRTKAKRKLRTLNPTFTPLDNESTEKSEALAASKAKRNPFSLAPPNSESSPNPSSVFKAAASQFDEDLGEAM